MLFVKLMITLVSYDLIYVFLFATCYSLPRLYDRFDGDINLYFHNSQNEENPMKKTLFQMQSYEFVELPTNIKRKAKKKKKKKKRPKEVNSAKFLFKKVFDQISFFNDI